MLIERDFMMESITHTRLSFYEVCTLLNGAPDQLLHCLGKRLLGGPARVLNGPHSSYNVFSMAVALELHRLGCEPRDIERWIPSRSLADDARQQVIWCIAADKSLQVLPRTATLDTTVLLGTRHLLDVARVWNNVRSLLHEFARCRPR